MPSLDGREKAKSNKHAQARTKRMEQQKIQLAKWTYYRRLILIVK